VLIDFLDAPEAAAGNDEAALPDEAARVVNPGRATTPLARLPSMSDERDAMAAARHVSRDGFKTLHHFTERCRGPGEAGKIPP
jgi:hypothetical protein